MRRVLGVLLLLVAITCVSFGQRLGDRAGEEIGLLSVSMNPLGFLQFGPVFNVEIGVTSNVAIQLHYRRPPLGLLTRVINLDDDTDLDEITGNGFGLGALYFLGDGMGKAYVGVIGGIQNVSVFYDRGEYYEWQEDQDTTVFIFNGGYRFRSDEAIFLALGAYFGAATTDWQWYYTGSGGATDPGIGNPETGTSITPFGMLEVTIGLEF